VFLHNDTGKFMLPMSKEKSRILPEHLTDILAPLGNEVHELDKLQRDCSLQEGPSEAIMRQSTGNIHATPAATGL